VERRVKLVGDGPAALVRGLSRALSEGVAEIAHTAEAALRSAPAAPGPGGVSSREEGR
jgi:hypothetical protein